MPFMPLVTAGIEKVLNTFLYQPRALKLPRQRLQGKVLRVVLQELSSPLVLVFSERQLDVLTQWEGDADCTVTTRLFALPTLQDKQQLPRLMRSGELEVEGDIQVIQHLSSLLDLAEFSPEEWLSPWIGDVAAHGLSKSFLSGVNVITRRATRNRRYLAEALTEEWRVALGPLEVAWYADECAVLSRDVDMLDSRLDKLEGK